ncbi:MAG: acyl-CoA dehydrogenase family protein [Ilumatobacteraceae bacterium]
MPLTFEFTEPDEQEEALRADVVEFLHAELPRDRPPTLGIASRHDSAFSKKMAARGWVGMALPARYGGHDRRAIDRFIVVEECLRMGAPLMAHWVADRQTGPTILTFGTEEQKQRFLPAIAAGECWFAIGMSEPDAGSDLAGVRTTATRVDGGWSVNGTKVWTSGAHESHWFIILCRTSADEGERHAGLSQLIVDLRSPGLTINSIPFLDGSRHFNEVVMDDVFVPDDLVLGEVGRGWQQVNSELAYERAGPDRYLSSWQIFRWLVESAPCAPGVDVDATVGRMTARFWAIRQMSMAVSRAIDAGRAPALEAAIVKDLGTCFEQEVIEMVHAVIEHEPSLDSADVGERLLAEAILTGPSFTIRGGTTEILRTIASKGLRA